MFCYILVLAKFLFDLVASTITVMLTATSSPFPKEPLNTVCKGKILLLQVGGCQSLA